jgi:hypothetical protein
MNFSNRVLTDAAAPLILVAELPEMKEIPAGIEPV